MLAANVDVEPAYAWHVSGEARFLGLDIKRQYPDLGPGWVYGSADVVARWPDRARVLDYKTGNKFDRSAKPAPENLQLRFLAVAVAALTGVRMVEVGLVFVEPGEPPRQSRWAYDALGLAAARAELRGIVAASERAEREPAAAVFGEAEDCRWCPSLAFCPAKLTAPLALQVPAGSGEMTGLRMGAIVRAARSVRELADRAETYALDWGEQNDIVLPDGTVLRTAERSAEYLDADVATRVLREMGAPPPKLRKTVSQEAVKDSLRRIAGDRRGELQRLYDELVATVRARKGITARVSRELREVER